MTDKEIISNSEEILILKKDITNRINSESSFDDMIKTSLKDDDLNRESFLRRAAIINAFTMEFRNLYGIEAPSYEISDDNTVPYSEGESEKRIDSKEIINAAELVDEDENELWQRFFVDSEKTKKGSPFFSPLCPPGLDKWSGDYIYRGVCKKFPITEDVIYSTLVNGNTNPSVSITSDINNKQYDSSNPIYFGITPSGYTKYNKFLYEITDSELKKAGWVCPMTNYRDSSPAEYIKPININKTAIYNFSLKDERGKTINEGLCAVCIDGNGNQFLAELYGNSKVVSNVYSSIKNIKVKKVKRKKRWRWWDVTTWFSNIKVTFTSKNNLTMKLTPADKNNSTTQKRILYFYEKMLKKVLDNTKFIYLKELNEENYTSVNEMKEIYNMIKGERENNSYSIASIISKISERHNRVYATTNKRANEINNFFKKNNELFKEAFSIIDSRINKREGSLVKVYNIIKNVRVSGNVIDSRLKNLAVKQNIIDAYEITMSPNQDSNRFNIKAEDWEDKDNISQKFGRGQKVYAVSDSNVRTLTLLQINGTPNPKSFEIITDKEIPSAASTEGNLRLVRVENVVEED